MINIINLLEKKKEKEAYKVIQKRWQIEKQKSEIERVKGAINEICESKA